MKRFDYSFLKNGNIPASLLNTISSIYSLSSFPNVYTELEKIAKIQSIKESNAIE